LVSQRDTGKIIANTRPRSNEQDFNNARLIASAPETAAERDRLKKINAELLEALEACVEANRRFAEINNSGLAHVLDVADSKARSAIAKTKGENR
jgi:hypothetical protein